MRAMTLGIFSIFLLASFPMGFQGAPVQVQDTQVIHQAFVDCNNVVIRKQTSLRTANWRWTLVIHDWDRDGLKNDVLFVGSMSRHIAAPHPPEQPNNPLASVELLQVCDLAAGQQPRAPQIQTAQVQHANHTDFIQVRADAQAPGVRISLQLDHLLPDSSAVPLDSMLTSSDTGVPEDTGADDQLGQDCNGNTISDSLEVSLGITADENEDGVLDECHTDAPRSGTSIWFILGVVVLILILLAWIVTRRTRGGRGRESDV